MPRIHSNNYVTTLDGSITDSDLTMDVNSVANLPTIGAGVFCYLTLQDGDVIEIVKVTSNASTTLTIERAIEGTAASAFPDGAVVSLRPTADSVDRKEDLISGRSLTTATVASNDKVLIQDTSNSDNLKTVTAQSIADLAGLSDGDKGDITVSSSGTDWRIDTPASATVAVDDKVLIKDTSASDAMKYVTTQSIADLSSTTKTATQNMVVGGNATAAGYIDFLEDSDNGSNKITITAPASVASDKTITFPDATGTFCLDVGSANIVTVGTITSGTWNGTTVDVAHGGTGVATTTAYGLIAGGTTSTGAFQNAGTGTSGQVYVSGGNAALGTWTSATGTGNIVKAISPTLVTPALGTPASGTLTNCVGGGGLRSFQIFTSGTAATYTKPANVTSILVEIVGGGGGGGGSAGGSGTLAIGGPGGGGGYARLFIASASSTYTYTVGAGGTAGTAGANNGGTGGTTTFSASSLSAAGGTGGTGGTATTTTNNSAAGLGGAGSNGDLNISGSDGVRSVVTSGSSSNGVAGVSGCSVFSGAVATPGVQAGTAGRSYGVGGGGGISTTVSFAGGAGSGGLIIVWEFA